MTPKIGWKIARAVQNEDKYENEHAVGRLLALRKLAGALGGSKRKKGTKGRPKRVKTYLGFKPVPEFGISREQMAKAERHFWCNPSKPWRAAIYVPSAFTWNRWF